MEIDFLFLHSSKARTWKGNINLSNVAGILHLKSNAKIHVLREIIHNRLIRVKVQRHSYKCLMAMKFNSLLIMVQYPV